MPIIPVPKLVKIIGDLTILMGITFLILAPVLLYAQTGKSFTGTNMTFQNTLTFIALLCLSGGVLFIITGELFIKRQPTGWITNLLLSVFGLLIPISLEKKIDSFTISLSLFWVAWVLMLLLSKKYFPFQTKKQEQKKPEVVLSKAPAPKPKPKPIPKKIEPPKPKKKKDAKKKASSQNKFTLSDHYTQLIELVVLIFFLLANYAVISYILNPPSTTSPLKPGLQTSSSAASLNESLFNQIQQQRISKLLYNGSSPVPRVTITNPF